MLEMLEIARSLAFRVTIITADTAAVLLILAFIRNMKFRGKYAAVKPVAVVTRNPYLPVPPAVAEQTENFMRQRRLPLTVILTAMAFAAVYGIYAVFSRSWDWLPFEASLLVFIPWMFYTLFLLLQKPVITARSHQAMLDSFTAHETTSVDILIPTAGEDLDVLANAFGYVAALYWPGSWRVYVLDESGRRDVSGLAARHGFHYLARPDRGRMKKAGNLNYGLRHSGGEFVVVFDADYAPASSFLMHTIPYFTDLATGIVQTPQEFDTDKKRTRSWVQRHSGVVQDMFMSWILPARQAHDSAFCIGSNVAYRRAALTVNGGFPEVETGGEDIVTTWDFIRHGYRTIYIPVNLSKGLCPDTFDASVNQQYRWCLSTLVVVAGSSAGRARRAFWDSPMTRWQRFNFYGGVLYYLQSILGLMLLVAPSLVMLWVYPYRINTGTYLLTMGVMTGMLFMPVILRGWRPSILRFTVVCSVTYMIALWDTVLRSHEGWTPTNGARNKGKTVRRVSTITRAWVVSTQGLAWWGIARDMHVYGLARLWPAVTLTLLQSVVLLPLLLPGYGVSYAPVKNAAAKVSAVLQPRQQLEPGFGAQAEQELDAILDDTDVFPAV